MEALMVGLNWVITHLEGSVHHMVDGTRVEFNGKAFAVINLLLRY